MQPQAEPPEHCRYVPTGPHRVLRRGLVHAPGRRCTEEVVEVRIDPIALQPQVRDDRAHRLCEISRRDGEVAVQVGGDLGHAAHAECQVELIRGPPQQMVVRIAYVRLEEAVVGDEGRERGRQVLNERSPQHSFTSE
jgi:hypothetical protein